MQIIAFSPLRIVLVLIGQLWNRFATLERNSCANEHSTFARVIWAADRRSRSRFVGAAAERKAIRGTYPHTFRDLCAIRRTATLPPRRSDTSRASEGQLHSIVGHLNAHAVFAAPDADLFPESRFVSRRDLCAAVRDDRPRHPRLFARPELHVDWCMSNQAVSWSADERPRNSGPISDVSRDALEGRLVIANVNQVIYCARNRGRSAVVINVSAVSPSARRSNRFFALLPATIKSAPHCAA